MDNPIKNSGGREVKEFNSDFCNVRYIEKDKMVLLTWKKFACGEDFIIPCSFTL